MATDKERCDEAARVLRIHEAFRAGDLTALLKAVDDPADVPNGRMPEAIGHCLVYAIYHSPTAFIRVLLERGADPNAAGGTGFPPLIAALSTRAAPGARQRTEVDDIVRMLLERGADPNQRGINDYTPLHMAVAERHALAIHTLLAHGANPELRTRVDECHTPIEMATGMGLDDIAALLARRGQPLRQRLRSGLTLLADVPGTGQLIHRLKTYRVRLRLWLNKGEPVRWQAAWGPVDAARLEDDGATLVTRVRIDRRSLVAGLFYGVDGMRVEGMRRFEIAPHLAYGERGVPGIIPANAVLTAEIVVLGVGD